MNLDLSDSDKDTPLALPRTLKAITQTKPAARKVVIEMSGDDRHENGDDAMVRLL